MTGTGKGIRPEVKVSTSHDGALQATLERTEYLAVKKVLAQANGNVTEAAALLGILRTSLYRIMKRYGIVYTPRGRN
jgi:transcriptional regulator of acetoin/glycerol metabolism